MKHPNFFIIGAPKCATTSMARWLGEHPNIFIPKIEEPTFFAVDILQKCQTWEEYYRYFENANENHIAVGEATTTYLFSKVAVREIENHFDDPLYIVMIRNPIEMAYSLHDHHLFTQREHIKDFMTAWRLSPARREGKEVLPRCRSSILLDYQKFCCLGEQIERLYSIIPKKRVLILVFDDIKLDTWNVYLQVLNYLGVPDDGRLSFPAYNTAKQWHSKILGRLIRLSSRPMMYLKHRKGILPRRSWGIRDFLIRLATKNRARSPLSPEKINELKIYYSDDVEKLSEIIGRDFMSLWNFKE